MSQEQNPFTLHYWLFHRDPYFMIFEIILCTLYIIHDNTFYIYKLYIHTWLVIISSPKKKAPKRTTRFFHVLSVSASPFFQFAVCPKKDEVRNLGPFLWTFMWWEGSNLWSSCGLECGDSSEGDAQVRSWWWNPWDGKFWTVYVPLPYSHTCWSSEPLVVDLQIILMKKLFTLCWNVYSLPELFLQWRCEEQK